MGVYEERPFADVYSSDRYRIYAREGGRDSGFSVEIPYGFKFLTERGVEGRRKNKAPPASAGGLDGRTEARKVVGERGTR